MSLTDDEREKIWKELAEQLNKSIDDDLKKAYTQGTWSSSPAPSPMPSGTMSYYGHPAISPTDFEARGMYPYQKPEQDEQGTLYGYKVLIWDERRERLHSPRYPAHWTESGELQADREPSERSMFGIHFTKRPDHPELRNYFSDFNGAAFANSNSLLVKCALSGTIVETEQGFRAQHAQIIGVYEDGDWTSYQDFAERATGYSRRNPYEEEYEREWRIYWGSRPIQKRDWVDPNTDS
jgi:hypothetical protein